MQIKENNATIVEYVMRKENRVENLDRERERERKEKKK